MGVDDFLNEMLKKKRKQEEPLPPPLVEPVKQPPKPMTRKERIAATPIEDRIMLGLLPSLAIVCAYLNPSGPHRFLFIAGAFFFMTLFFLLSAQVDRKLPPHTSTVGIILAKAVLPVALATGFLSIFSLLPYLIGLR